MAVTQLRSITPRRSPERQVLAEAIERRTVALDAFKRVNQAHEESTEVVYRASEALKIAETAVEQAQADGDARLAAAALGEIENADLEAALAQAANDLSIARRTRDALAQRAQREATEVEGAERKVEEAVRAVLASECAGIIAELMSEGTALREQLCAKIALLRFLKTAAFKSWPPSEVPEPVQKFLNTATDNWSDGHPACVPWANALKALATDADAPLPT